jgi:hypothetical protein
MPCGAVIYFFSATLKREFLQHLQAIFIHILKQDKTSSFQTQIDLKFIIITLYLESRVGRVTPRPLYLRLEQTPANWYTPYISQQGRHNVSVT